MTESCCVFCLSCQLTMKSGSEPPAIWKVQKALLQKFVPELRDGKRVFSATNSVSKHTPESPVDLVFSFFGGGIMTPSCFFIVVSWLLWRRQVHVQEGVCEVPGHGKQKGVRASVQSEAALQADELSQVPSRWIVVAFSSFFFLSLNLKQTSSPLCRRSASAGVFR